MTRRPPLAAFAVAAALALAGGGCGKRGAPLPPEPKEPLAPDGVRVRQVGRAVVVTCGLPEVRGDRPSQALGRVELVRVTFPPGVEPGQEAAVFRRRGEIVTSLEGADVVPGTRVALVDPIAQAEGPTLVGWSVRYGVRVRDRRGRPSPLVASETLVPLEPPVAPVGLAGEAVADGIALAWEGCDDPGAGFQVYRGEAGGDLDETPRNAAPLRECSFVDGAVRIGTTYRYVVHRLAVEAAPPRESAPSAEIQVAAEDRFPPDAPRNPVAVQEGDAVRLFWDPGPERDLRGYRVERAIGDGTWERITPVPVPDALYLDRDVRAGQRIRYRVVAEDGASPPNESEPSEEVVVVVAADRAGGGDR